MFLGTLALAGCVVANLGVGEDERRPGLASTRRHFRHAAWRDGQIGLLALRFPMLMRGHAPTLHFSFNLRVEFVPAGRKSAAEGLRILPPSRAVIRQARAIHKKVCTHKVCQGDSQICIICPRESDWQLEPLGGLLPLLEAVNGPSLKGRSVDGTCILISTTRVVATACLLRRFAASRPGESDCRFPNRHRLRHTAHPFVTGSLSRDFPPPSSLSACQKTGYRRKPGRSPQRSTWIHTAILSTAYGQHNSGGRSQLT